MGEHAKRDHSDVCLTFLFSSHDFGSTLGVAYIGTVCSVYRPTIISNGQTVKLSANTGFITFDGKTFVPTSHLTFAHEVGHNMGSSHDGVGPTSDCPPKGYLMASFAPSRPTEENKRFSSCSLESINKAVQKLLNDPQRQCMVEHDHLTKPKVTERPITLRPDINIDIDRIIPIKTTETPDSESDSSTSVIYIISGVLVVLVIVIAVLLFCLCSKRDPSPCPTRSDFGRRYTQVRGNVRKSMMFLSKQMSFRKNDEDHQKLDTVFENESQSNTPEIGRKIAPTRLAPNYSGASPHVQRPAPYTTPSSQMIPKVKPKRPFEGPSAHNHQTSQMSKLSSDGPKFSPKGPQFNNNRNTPTFVPKRPESPKFSHRPQPGALNSQRTFLQPKNLNTPRWDRGQMSREESEDLLSGDMIGAFLVRTSKGQKVLSLKDVGRVKHIKLDESSGQVTGDNKVFFSTIQELIDYYKMNPIPGTSNVRLK